MQGNEYTSEEIEKLGQLEDIEDGLSIDLTILFKALKDGIYAKDDYGNIIHGKPQMDINGLYLSLDYEFQYEFKFSDYGKTWALTKEELQ